MFRQKLFSILIWLVSVSAAAGGEPPASYSERIVSDGWHFVSHPFPKKFHRNPDEPIIPYGFPRQSPVRIDSRRLGLCLAKATAAYGESRLSFQPAKSICIDPPSWKPKTLTAKARKSAFFPYLAADSDRACEYMSGHEENLKREILAARRNSVDIVRLYSMSLRQNQGDIFNAVLTIHQLLRETARWYDTDRYAYESDPDREKLFFDQFIDIRGDLKERGHGFSGDHAGSWYRMWGVMLFQMERINPTAFRERLIDSKTSLLQCHNFSGDLDLNISIGAGLGGIASVGDEIIKWKEGTQDDFGKAHIDADANSATSWMLWALLHRPCSFDDLKPTDCLPSSYLRPVKG